MADRVKRCGMASISSTRHPRRLADYSADYRMLILAAMAVVAGTGGAFSAWALLKLIALATNILWHGRLSFDPTAIAGARRAAGVAHPGCRRASSSA